MGKYQFSYEEKLTIIREHEENHKTLKAICEAVKIPVIAIGGITKENVRELAGSGICGIAVISAIFAQEDVKEASKELCERTKEMLAK